MDKAGGKACGLRPVPTDVLLLLYKSFVVPIFDYCDVVWYPVFVRIR